LSDGPAHPFPPETMSLIGYARVSAEQDLALQHDALHAAGAARIFEDRGVSGARTERPGLNAALSFLRDGDILVVWKLDRLGRSMTHLLQTVANLDDRGVGFRSLTENIDTTTPTGRLVFHIFGALGQFERDLIRERTNAGLTAAARGRKGGRPMAATPERVARGRQLIATGLTVREAAARVKVGKSALYAALRNGEPENDANE
jgi:DNA invertase Pin-like site-specific DNA recombinase